ncbi:LuxR C-terminal-related transcriptional regulator [Sphingomonas sp.]|uniref:helix-turn-helix transcriptional regulator n=1 Tax=Sphingomonas sp. TaxID=28214 RepID=UPI0025FC341E|nr:LuxR C-terminal-related transcriptional regulator [Sphingomonas sp.]
MLLLISHLKNLKAGLWDYNIDLDILECDATWHDLLGIGPGMMRSIADFRPFIFPDDVDRATAIDPESVNAMIELDEQYHVDFRVVRSDGQVRWWRSVASLIVDSHHHRRAIGCVTDTTDLHRGDLDPAPAAPPPPERVVPDIASRLSGREIECLRWVSIGKTAWETSRIVEISQRTVEFHLSNAARKLEAKNKVHAAVIAVRAGII